MQSGTRRCGGGSNLSIAQLAEKASAQYEELQEQLQNMEGRRVLDEFGQDVSRLASGEQLRDAEGKLRNTARVINAVQAKERVSRDRGRRFMLYALEEQRLAAAEAGHDCCRGSTLVIRVGLSHVALGRVIRLKLLGPSGDDSKPTSFKLEPGSKKQSFQLELLYPDGVVNIAAAGEGEGSGIDMLQFCSSGRMLPHCPAVQVLRMVSRTSLHPIKETIFARMEAADAISLRNDPQAGGLKPWATLDLLTKAQNLSQDLQLPNNTLCFGCHLGWSDDSTGPLLCCKGDCKRAFHTTCHPNFPLETQVCGRCSGKDIDICCKCDLEWSDPDPESDFYSGEMVGCDGACKRWFHQQCHFPIITEVEVRSKAQWHCADCSAGQEPTAQPTLAAPGAPAASPTTALIGDEAPTLAQPIAAAAPLVPPKVGWEVVEVVLSRGARGYGFTLEGYGSGFTGKVEAVMQGCSGAVAGLEKGDVIVGVDGARLQLSRPFASHLQGRQREGVRLKLTVHRRCRADDPHKRQRTVAQQPGMQVLLLTAHLAVDYLLVPHTTTLYYVLTTHNSLLTTYSLITNH